MILDFSISLVITDLFVSIHQLLCVIFRSSFTLQKKALRVLLPYRFYTLFFFIPYNKVNFAKNTFFLSIVTTIELLLLNVHYITGNGSMIPNLREILLDCTQLIIQLIYHTSLCNRLVHSIYHPSNS